MRNPMIAAAAALALIAFPAALNAQDQTTESAPTSAAELNQQIVPGEPTTTTVPASSPDQPATVVTTYPGNLTPPPAQAMNREYPVCRGAIQDSCQNPGEGGAPGRSRALSYWPGEPASERDTDTDSGG